MVFDDMDLSGRRLSRRRGSRLRNPLLEVEAGAADRRASLRLTAGLVLAALAFALGVCLTWWAIRALFVKNDRYNIAHLEIKIDPEGMVGEDLIRRQTGLREGQNLFAFKMNRIRREALMSLPNVRFASITRQLPDTLRIEVEERDPVAIVVTELQRTLGVDREGCVFVTRTRGRRLPLIVGYSVPWLRPGSKVLGLTRDAVDVVDACRNMPVGSEIDVVWIDAKGGFRGRDDSLRLHLAAGTAADLWWDRQDRKSGTDREKLSERLLHLGHLLREAGQRNKPLETVDLTLNRYRENCPVTPAW